MNEITSFVLVSGFSFSFVTVIVNFCFLCLRLCLYLCFWRYLFLALSLHLSLFLKFISLAVSLFFLVFDVWCRRLCLWSLALPIRVRSYGKVDYTDLFSGINQTPHV